MNKHFQSKTSGEKSLSAEQVHKLLDLTDTARDYALLLLAVDLGARRADLVSIEIPNINFETGAINYYENKKRKWITRFVSPKTITALKRYLATRKDAKRWLFPSEQTNTKNKHINSKTAYNIFDKALKRIGLDKRGIHTLRATCCKLKQTAGWTIQETAFHIDDKIDTVRKHYTTPSYSELEELAKSKPSI